MENIRAAQSETSTFCPVPEYVFARSSCLSERECLFLPSRKHIQVSEQLGCSILQVWTLDFRMLSEVSPSLLQWRKLGVHASVFKTCAVPMVFMISAMLAVTFRDS